jgi:DNA primase large subunit
VHHIATGTGNEYIAPTCKTMNSYGNCPSNKAPYCKYIEHPLVYYRRTVVNREKMQEKLKEAEKGQQKVTENVV